MVVFYITKCSFCGLLCNDFEKHSDNECKRRLKLQVEKLKERLKRRLG